MPIRWSTCTHHMVVTCLPGGPLVVRGGLEDVLHVVGQDQAEEVSASLL